MTIRAKTLPDSWLTFNSQSMLGGALVGEKKFAAAETLLLNAYNGLKKREKAIPFQGKIRLVEAVERLVQLYAATGKPNEVKKWQAERARLPEHGPPPREKK